MGAQVGGCEATQNQRRREDTFARTRSCRAQREDSTEKQKRDAFDIEILQFQAEIIKESNVPALNVDASSLFPNGAHPSTVSNAASAFDCFA